MANIFRFRVISKSNGTRWVFFLSQNSNDGLSKAVRSAQHSRCRTLLSERHGMQPALPMPSEMNNTLISYSKPYIQLLTHSIMQ